MNDNISLKDVKCYVHCAKCIAEKPRHKSARDYAQFSVGITDSGILIWCDRHDIPIVHYALPGVGDASCECDMCKKGE